MKKILLGVIFLASSIFADPTDVVVYEVQNLAQESELNAYKLLNKIEKSVDKDKTAAILFAAECMKKQGIPDDQIIKNVNFLINKNKQKNNLFLKGLVCAFAIIAFAAIIWAFKNRENNFIDRETKEKAWKFDEVCRMRNQAPPYILYHPGAGGGIIQELVDWCAFLGMPVKTDAKDHNSYAPSEYMIRLIAKVFGQDASSRFATTDK